MTAVGVRVSVVAGVRRLDLVVPPELPVAELVPGLARRLAVVAPDGLRLRTVTGGALRDDAGLSAQGVRDGSLLTLGPPAPAPVLHDGLAEALGDVAPGGGGRPVWLAPAAAATMLGAGAIAAAVAAAPILAATTALLLLAVGLATGGWRPVGALIAVVASCGYAADAAGLVAAHAGRGPGTAVAAAGGAVLAVLAVALPSLRVHGLGSAPVLVVVTVATVATVAGIVGAVAGLPLAGVEDVLLGVLAALDAAVPWVGLMCLGVSAPLDGTEVARRARAARNVVTGLSVGLLLAQVVMVPVVAWTDLWGVALASCVSVLSLLRAARSVWPLPALPSAVAGSAGLLLTITVALWRHPEWCGGAVAGLAAAGTVLLLRPRLRPGGAVLRHVGRSLETACVSALPPLVVLASGALGALS